MNRIADADAKYDVGLVLVATMLPTSAAAAFLGSIVSVNPGVARPARAFAELLGALDVPEAAAAQDGY